MLVGGDLLVTDGGVWACGGVQRLVDLVEASVAMGSVGLVEASFVMGWARPVVLSIL